jgi:hypothetical protein
MSAQSKLDWKARSLLYATIEAIETLPVQTPQQIATRMGVIVEVCEAFTCEFIDFNPGLFLEACEVDSYITLPT